VRHRDAFRMRCPGCGDNFCVGCSLTPYHLGRTCQQQAHHAVAAKCRFCDDALEPQPAAEGGRKVSASRSSGSVGGSGSGSARLRGPDGDVVEVLDVSSVADSEVEVVGDVDVDVEAAGPPVALPIGSKRPRRATRAAVALRVPLDKAAAEDADDSDDLAPAPPAKRGRRGRGRGAGGGAVRGARRRGRSAGAAAVAVADVDVGEDAGVEEVVAAVTPSRMPPLLPCALPDVCAKAECQQRGRDTCWLVHGDCHHPCGGIAAEATAEVRGPPPAVGAACGPRCLPCLHEACVKPGAQQNAEDYCNVCFVEALRAAPAVQLQCGHAFHHHCLVAKLKAGWVGPRITFSFAACPLCSARISHWALADLTDPINKLEATLRDLATQRLRFEGLDKDPAIVTPGGRWFGNPTGFAMDRFSYSRCDKCAKPFFTGMRQCQPAGAGAEGGGGAGGAGGGADARDADAQLLCSGCTKPPAGVSVCKRHGATALEYKCRYCCTGNLAVWFCFGT